MMRDGKYITVNGNSRTSSEVRMKYLPSIKDTLKEDKRGKRKQDRNNPLLVHVYGECSAFFLFSLPRMQWSLQIMDTIGTQPFVLCREVVLFQSGGSTV